MTAKKGDWVRLYDVVLTSEERAPQVPDDTKKVPLERWITGLLVEESAEIGDKVSVETLTGRIVSGELVEIAPTYKHSFGNHVPELLKIGRDLREILFGGGADA